MELGCKTRQSGPRLCVWRAMLYYLRWNWLVYISLSPHWEKAMAPPSSTLALKIPRTEESGRLQSMGSLSWTRLSKFTFTFRFHALEKEMATHSSVLAWRIPGTGEPGGLPSMGSHRVGHDWSDLAANWVQVVGLLNCTASHRLIGYVSLEADLKVPNFSPK